MASKTLRWCFGFFLSVLAWLLLHGWQKPAAIRGWQWALSFWVQTLCGAYLFNVLLRSGRPVLGPVVLMLVSGWYASYLAKKPRKLARPLSYRRHR